MLHHGNPGSAGTPTAGGRWFQVSTVPRKADESTLRGEFQRRGRPLVQGQIHSDWDWYFTMQHYGLPTRLLDWTKSSLVALHFALRGNNRRSPAAVWVLDPWRLNERVTGKKDLFLADGKTAQKYLPSPYSGIQIPEYPVALLPAHSSPRIVAQMSCFTVFGSRRNGLAEVASADSRTELHKIEISPKAFHQMRGDLETCGVYESSVFPDLEGLSRELRNRFGR